MREQTFHIESGYAFDVTNPNYIAGYANDVFIATVVDVVDTQASRQQTLHAVEIQQSFKGTARGRIIASQLGYIDGGDRDILDDQPMLQDGHTCLLAVNRAESNQYTAIAGPEAVIDLNSIDRETLVRRWAQIVANQQYPPGLPRR